MTPSPYSPTAFELSTTAQLPTWSEVQTGPRCAPSPSLQRYFYYYTTSISTTWENISLNNGRSQSFSGTGAYPSVWVYDLPTYQTFSWTGTFTAITREVKETVNACTGSYSNQTIFPVTYGPRVIPVVSIDGSFSTSLSITPGSPFVTASFNSNRSAAKLTVNFNDSLPATIQGSLTSNSGTETWSSSAPTVNGAYTLPNYSPVDQQYTLSVRGTSRTGSSTSPGPPALSLSYSGSGSSPAETTNADCSFTLTSSVPSVTISSAKNAPYTSLNATTVNVTWNSSADALGFFTYYELGTPINWTISGIAPVESSSGNWVYSIELHGLEPMVAYNGTFGVSWNKGCLVEEDQMVGQNFQTATDPAFDTDPTLPYIWEQDLPYDSINSAGGGIEVGWNTPSNSTLGSGVHTLTSGFVQVAALGEHSVASFVPAQVVQSPSGGSNLLNLSTSLPALALNQRYTYKVVANYSYTKVVKGKAVQSSESAQLSGKFTYQLDTSKDGLSDVEKEKGWIVPLNGGGFTVTANPADYSTNGLVSDYVEKEYSLDPRTLDTAGSHMLDTWNLTFDLGPISSSPLLPPSSVFHYFYENSTYYFSKTCQNFDPGQGKCSFTPVGPEPTNLVCTTSGLTCYNHGWTGDSDPGAGTILWSSKNLNAFEKLISGEKVGWLRATTGTYGTDRTITVWGKLSWGANPLVTSTQSNGLPDGGQTNPVSRVILQINISAWWADIPADGDGASPYVSVAPSAPSSPLYYSGFGPEVSAVGVGYPTGGTRFSWVVPWFGDYVTSVPIASSKQFIDWRIQMFANNSSNGRPTAVTSTSWVQVDLTNLNHTVPEGLLFTNSSIKGEGDYGEIWANYTVLARPLKANTLLVVPANSTSISPVPWGLKRYTGEPDFDLLILNLTGASSPVSVSGIRNAEGDGSYSVTLQPGLNNLLVPRSIFLHSPLDQALLNDSNVVLPSRGGVAFTSDDWSSRTQEIAGNNASNSNFIWVFAPSNQSQLDTSLNASDQLAFGGIPGNTGVEAGYESRQIQTEFWINVSSTHGYSSLSDGAAELRDIVGGLVLNSTDKVVNDLLSITSVLSTIGLPANVLSVLADQAVVNDGSYPAPQWSTPLPLQPGSFAQLIEVVWNTVTGVAAYIASGLEYFASVVWSVNAAASAYITGAVDGAITSFSHGLSKVASQTVHALQSIEEAMVWAAQQLLRHIEAIAIDGIQRAFGTPANYARSVGAELYDSSTDYAAGNAHGAAVNFNSALGLPLGIGTAVGITLTVVTSLLLPFAGFFVLPLGAIIGGLVQRGMGIPGNGGSNPRLDPQGSTVSQFLTSLSQGLGDLFPQVSESTAQLFAWIVPVLEFVGLVAALVQLALDYSGGNPIFLPFVAGFFVVAVFFAAIAATSNLNSSTLAPLAMAALAFAALSLVCDTLTIAYSDEFNPVLGIIIGIVDIVVVWWAIDRVLN